MLFRPEEVVFASSAAHLDDGLFGQNLREAPIVGFQIDTISAMGTGVCQLNTVLMVLAVDQQQEIDRSRYAESFTIGQRQGMEREA